MKNLIIFIGLLFVFCVQIFAQENSSCPKLSIIAPTRVVPFGQDMIFTAKIDGFDIEKISYQWTVSSAEIDEGQQTKSIKIKTDKLSGGLTITVGVTIKEFPIGCKNETFASADVASSSCSPPLKFDEYENISITKEKRKLDVVVDIINKDQDLMAFFIIYRSKKSSNQNIKIRQNRITKYLTEKHKISPNKFQIIDGGISNNKIEVWIRPIASILSK